MPDNVTLSEQNFESNIYVPLLDDPILPIEVQNQTKLLKANKACGPDGLSPGMFKIMLAQWILFLCNIVNTIFMQDNYPLVWSRAKLVTVFKKSSKKETKNYRGISIINNIAKLYDIVLYSRLKQWFMPHREQAGGQEKRGYDMTKRKRLKLYKLHRLFAGVR